MTTQEQGLSNENIEKYMHELCSYNEVSGSESVPSDDDESEYVEAGEVDVSEPDPLLRRLALGKIADPSTNIGWQSHQPKSSQGRVQNTYHL